jgi:ribulose-5-phosphate 4-epimerase/fuculose-1-phosphate aldolase
MHDRDPRSLLVALGLSLFARGYAVGGAGNISLRLPDGTILATPTNSCLGRLDPERLSLCGMDGAHNGGDAPTKELPLHLALYRARPECNAVVHLHATYVTALSCLADLDPVDALRPFAPYYVLKVGRLPVVPYYRPGAPELAVKAGACATIAPAFLLANHGCVVCGASLVEAVNAAEELEETAKLHFLLHSSSRPVRYLTDGEITELAPKRKAAP